MDKKPADKSEPPGKRIIAKRLAEDLDVSISTISRAFNKEAVIAPETRSKVLDYANRLGYRPNPFARSLITSKSRIVSIIASHLENPFYPEALRGLGEALRKAGWHVMLFTVPSGETPDDILPARHQLSARIRHRHGGDDLLQGPGSGGSGPGRS